MTVYWDTIDDWTKESGPGTVTYTDYLQIAQNSTTFTQVISNSKIQADGDFDIKCKFLHGYNGGSKCDLQQWFFWDPGVSDYIYSNTGFYSSDTTYDYIAWQIYDKDNNQLYTSGKQRPYDFSTNCDVWFWNRIKKVGNHYMFKVWKVSEEEPAAWTVDTYLDSFDLTFNGYGRVAGRTADIVRFDDFNITDSGYLDGWNNRIKFEIDPSKIDADLTDFPVLLNLSSAMGRNSDDVTAVFDELLPYDHNPIVTGDDFTGSDNDDLDTNLWQAYTGGYAEWDIQSEKANAAIASSDTDPARQSISLFTLSGDFDIQFDYDITTGPATDSWSINFKATQWNNYNHFRVRRAYTSGHKYTTRARVADVNGTEDSESTTDTSGKMRMTRVGNVFHGYYWTGSAWDEISTGETISGCDTDLHIMMEAEQSVSDPAIDVNFDNFVINSGTVVWPYKLRDSFTGTDTDPPDPNLWESNTPGELDSNKLKCAVASGDAVKSASSKFFLTGDFDIQVDFDTVTHPSTTSWYGSIRVHDENKDNLNQILYGYDGSDRWQAQYRNNGGSYTNYGTPYVESITSGKFRITRSGSTVSVYRWNGSSFVLYANDTLGLGSADAYVQIFAYTHTSTPTARVDFDNFVINSGTIVWPAGTNPNRKKIAVTTEDNTECYVEIEKWDDINEKAILWAKVPNIDDTKKTALFLYYDSGQIQNTAYVGDTGDTPAESVWDDDFKAVYHMRQDPEVGNILDSTDNGYELTPNGTMLSEDLTDDGIDFDGNDDYLSNASLLYPTSINLTIAFEYDGVPTAATNFMHQGDATKSLQQGVAFRQLATTHEIGIGWFSSPSWRSVYCTTIPQNGKNFASVSINSSTLKATFTVNGITEEFDMPTALPTSPYSFKIGAYKSTTLVNYFNGKISEARVSTTPRSDAWNKATYHALFDELLAVAHTWDNRVKITVDYTKVDSTLTNFPILLPLGASVGQGDDDLTLIFDELIGAVTGDDFTGTDDDLLNENLWEDFSGYTGFDIQSNAANGAITGGSAGERRSVSVFKMSGDFDVQFDYDLNTAPDTNNWAVFIRATEAGEDSWFQLKRAYENSSGEYSIRSKDNGFLYSEQGFSTTHTSGKLRLTRSGQMMRGYEWTGSAWQQVSSGATNVGLDTDIYLLMGASITSGFPTIDVQLDNFVINSGTVKWPDNKNPDRKKIMATLDDDTECFIEIERWDDANEKAALWVRVPSISSSADTVLFLYYDKDVSQNISYVGDTGDEAAQAVWDDDFINVWHLAQDPTGGAGCIKDSKALSNATPYGTMTAGDLVEGQLSGGGVRALDFDGNNDYLDVLNSYDPTGDSEVTVEAVARPDVLEPKNYIFAGEASYNNVSVAMGPSSTSGYIWFWLNLSSTNNWTLGSSVQVTQGNWHYIAGNYKNGENCRLFVDNNVEAHAYGSGTIADDFAGYHSLGGRPGASSYYDQRVSEVRYSNIKRSDAWHKATYYTCFDNFLAFSGLPAGGGGGGRVLPIQGIHSSIFGGAIVR